MSQRSLPPYTWLAIRPQLLSEVLAEAPISTADRAFLFALLISTNPRDGTVRLSVAALRQLAGEPNPRAHGGGGWLSGATSRLQRAGLLVKVPAAAGGPAWMVNPGLLSGAGGTEQRHQRWRKFQALQGEFYRRDQLKAMAKAEKQRQQQEAQQQPQNSPSPSLWPWRPESRAALS